MKSNQNKITPIGTGKSILLMMPNDIGISDLIAESLTNLEFDVIFAKKQPFVYRNFLERIINFIRKNIFQDRHYKQRLQSKQLMQTVMTELSSRKEKVDYALFIRADTFSEELIQFTKEYSKTVISYHWDGLTRFEGIIPRIPLFDHFFVFDEDDLNVKTKQELKLITNFYFSLPRLPAPISNQHAKKQVYFLGAHLPQRVDMIVKIMDKLKDQDVDLKFHIGKPAKSSLIQQYQNHPIIFLDKGISYEENLRLVSETDIVVDLVNRVHKGLSFRAFEALFYKKKLITNNAEIAKYDFYRPSNVFIFDENNIDADALSEFINSPIEDLPDEIYQKYGFTNWIKNILSIEPHIKI